MFSGVPMAKASSKASPESRDTGNEFLEQWLIDRELLFVTTVLQSLSHGLNNSHIDFFPPRTPNVSSNHGIKFEISISCNLHQVWIQMRVFMYSVYSGETGIETL